MKPDVFTHLTPFAPELLDGPHWEHDKLALLMHAIDECRHAGGTPVGEDWDVSVVDTPPGSYEGEDGETIDFPAGKALLVRIPCTREVTS